MKMFMTNNEFDFGQKAPLEMYLTPEMEVLSMKIGAALLAGSYEPPIEEEYGYPTETEEENDL